MKKVLSMILAGIAAGCLIGAGILITERIQEDRQAQALWEELRPQHSLDAASQEDTISQEPSSAEPSDKEPTEPSSTESSDQETADKKPFLEDTPREEESSRTLLPNPYADSFLSNEDMAAWLVIPGTDIDYPVMWTPRDENYYLYRDFHGKDNQNGCLILDTDSSLTPLTTNLIIHGHNMKSGAMFGNLTDYEDPDYCQAHSQIILHTPDMQRKYEVVAVFRSQVYKKSDQVFKFYQFFRADTEEEFHSFYDNIKELSLYDTGVTAQFGDHFITLSTCVYHVTNGRFVVVAKEVENDTFYETPKQ